VPAPPASTPPHPNTELGNRIDSAPGLVVAGERLNAGLLRRFYAAHGFEQVWTNRQAQANSLLNAVLRADDHGIAPELFHANLLRNTATLQPLDRELLLSDAFLSYADALAHGAMPVERRTEDEALTPEPIDVAAALDTAIGSPNPAVAIEALAPTTPTYRVLRQALQSYRSGTPAGDQASTNRVRQLEVNLERERWLPRRLPAERVWVNAADARLVIYRAGKPVYSTRVIVGQDGKPNQTPEFEVTIEGVCSTLHGTSRSRSLRRRSGRRSVATRIICGGITWSRCPMAVYSSCRGTARRSGTSSLRWRTGSTFTCTTPR
jgi:murein L,D-transpeptidase YcbB/YkuD